MPGYALPLTQLTKSPPSVGEADDGAVYLLYLGFSNREAHAPFPDVLSYDRNRDSRLYFQRQRERPPNGYRTRRDRAFFQRNALDAGVAFYLDLIGQLGGCNPGDASHSLMCEPVSACRAFRISSSRAAPGGSCKASSRRRFASCANRTSRLVDWMIVPPLAQGRTYKEGCNCVNAAFLTRRLQFRDAFVHTFGLSSETSELHIS